MRTLITVIALTALFTPLAACQTVFPNSHPGHSREFSTDYTVTVPTGDTSGLGAGGSFETRITSTPSRHNMRPLPSQRSRRY